ncbi:hypothetical protein Hte_001796 [Hypoxylon texense]
MDRTIYVNKEKVSITRNLHRALAHLQHKTKPRVLWVDALCINQIDIGEREAQVSQMCNIYGYATRVLVWLNMAPFGTRQAFQAAQRDKSPTSYHLGTVGVVSKLLASPWWMRVWVVLEFIVVKVVLIQCSSYTLEWDDFCGLVDSAIRSPCFVPNGTYLDEYHALRAQRLSRTLNASGNNLLELLFAFRTKHATDPRDKIFAFLALTNINEAQGDSNTVVRAYYVAKPEDVFQDCPVKLINASESLSILTLAECVETSHLRRELPADEVVTVGQTADASWIEFIDLFEHGGESPKIIAALDAWGHWERVLPQWKELTEPSSGLSRGDSITRRAFHRTVSAGLYRDLFNDADGPGLMSAARASSYGRAFFVTASGLFGLGPGGTMPGDKVYILLGSDVPVILRQIPNPRGRRQEAAISTTGDPVPPQLFVGQAYVDELMAYRGDLKEDLGEGRRAVDYVYIV